MAHTCGMCSGGVRLIVAPTASGGIARLKPALRVNPNYHHDGRSWKRTSKARKQYLRRAR